MVKDATRGTAVIVAVHGGELWSDLAFVMLQRVRSSPGGSNSLSVINFHLRNREDWRVVMGLLCLLWLGELRWNHATVCGALVF